MSLDDIKRDDTPQDVEVDEDKFSSFAEVNRREAPTKKRRFRAGTRSLIIAVSVAVSLALILTMLIVFLPTDIDDNQSSNVSDETSEIPVFTVYDRSSENAKTAIVQTVEFNNSFGKYTLQYDDKSAGYHIKGYEELELSKNLEDFIGYCIKLDADDEIENVKSLSDFGFDKPLASVTITYYDGVKRTVDIGNLVATEDGYYLNERGSDKVYMVVSDTANYFMAADWWYVSTTLFTAPAKREDDENGSAILKEISISGKNHTDAMTIRRPLPQDGEEFSYYKYVTVKPFLRGVTDSVGDAFYGLQSLYADRAAVLHPTAAQKKSLGFNDPYSVIKFTLAIELIGDVEDMSEEVTPKSYYNNQEHTITVGCKDNEGYYYIMVDDVDVIYQISTGSLQLLAERQITNTISSLLFLKKIDAMSKVSLRVDDKDYTFELTHYPDKQEANDKLKVKMDGKSYDSANFRNLYVLLMDLERYGRIDTCPTGKSDIALKLHLNDGSLYLGVDFYRQPSGSLYMARTSDGEIFSITASSVNTLLTQIDNYLKGETVVG